MRLTKLQKAVVAALEDVKAHDIVTLDTRKLSSLFDCMIIASADSVRQTRALAAHLRDTVKEQGGTIQGVEGLETGEWVLVDLGATVVHIMQPAVRAYYDLDSLWGARPKAPRARQSAPSEAA